MKLGSSRLRDKQRRRRRVLGALLKIVIFGGIVLAIAAYAWKTGSEVMRHEAATLKEQNLAIDAELAKSREALTAAHTEEAVLRSKLPTASEQTILEAARIKLTAGVSANRITEVVSAVTAERKCDNAPTSKRFRVRTPIASNEANSATFADNTMTVSAEGVSAKNESGSPEAWFDVKKPISVTFMHLSGAASRTDGVLPISHAVAVGKSEYRFQIQEGPRSLITVTMDRCDYP